MENIFHSHGKLLLTGEYVVLDGAVALAVPTKFGQSMEVRQQTGRTLRWKSLDEENKIWFDAEFKFDETGLFPFHRSNVIGFMHKNISGRLQNILLAAHELNPTILDGDHGFDVKTKLEFPLDWGLGTSSTLINNIAQWFKIDAFQLLERTFRGSGYDIAVAQKEQALTYQLTKKGRSILTANFNPEFKEELFFVYLNRKQNSRNSISHYKAVVDGQVSGAIEKISSITHQILNCKTISEFELLLEIHENIISREVQIPKIKSQLFPDFPRSIKSLGGWGGDFILATGNEAEKNYFRKKGYSTILDYTEMVQGET